MFRRCSTGALNPSRRFGSSRSPAARSRAARSAPGPPRRAAAALIAVVWALVNQRRWAPAALLGVLVAELAAGALWSAAYRGGTIYFGLEGETRAVLVNGPLRWPDVDLDAYLQRGPIARTIAERADGRYLAWVPPAAYFNKGYLFTQDEADWPALFSARIR